MASVNFKTLPPNCRIVEPGNRPKRIASGPPSHAEPLPATMSPIQPQRPAQGLYGSHEVEEFPGIRFVATGITEGCKDELAAVCLKHGARCASTDHFIKHSKSNSEPQPKKPKP